MSDTTHIESIITMGRFMLKYGKKKTGGERTRERERERGDEKERSKPSSCRPSLHPPALLHPPILLSDHLSIHLSIHPFISKGVKGAGKTQREGAYSRPCVRASARAVDPLTWGAETKPTGGWKCSGFAAPAFAPWTRRSSARSGYWTTPRSPAAFR